MSFLPELRQTLLPARDSKHGPLPPLLVAMTFVTGLVDAFSYLLLGHVFVANMTGNVVLLGFALVGRPASRSPRRSYRWRRLRSGRLSEGGLALGSPSTEVGC
jgi:hypothetical protein